MKVIILMLFVFSISFGAKKSVGLYKTPTSYYKSYDTKPRVYKDGGTLYLQKYYTKQNGTIVNYHLKTKPDEKKWNNLNYGK